MLTCAQQTPRESNPLNLRNYRLALGGLLLEDLYDVNHDKQWFRVGCKLLKPSIREAEQIPSSTQDDGRFFEGKSGAGPRYQHSGC